MTDPVETHASGEFQPPPYDAAAVGRVASHIQIEGIELVYAHFDRVDDQPLSTTTLRHDPPEVGIDLVWDVAPDGRKLGCAARFAALFPDQDPSPYSLFAEFRLTYTYVGDAALEEHDVEQFVYWNALFNAWPYWREYLSSTINRGNLPRFFLPVMRVPLARMTEDSSAPSENDQPTSKAAQST